MRSSRASSVSISNCSVKPYSDDLNIGDSILVQRDILGKVDDYVATIIDIKEVDAGFLEKQYAGAQSIEANTENRMNTKHVFYVHYNSQDRRLDEWIDKSRILDKLDSPSSSTAESNKEPVILTRSQRRMAEEFKHLPKEIEELDPISMQFEREHEERTKVKNIDVIQFGRYEINAWYFSPFPECYSKSRRLYFCEFCLAYTPDINMYRHHALHQCKRNRPPGTEIYRDDERNVAIFEVDGKTNKTYCQCICLLAKLFLDHKTLYFDVDYFLFYIICETDEKGSHIVGFFSKERGSSNNLACIMVLPPFQRKGYGKLLIQLSYYLSHREQRIGTPEKPLSDLGKVSYRSFWWWLLLGKLDELQIDSMISVKEVSRITGIHPEDIQSTFQPLNLVKFWRGEYVLHVNRAIIRTLVSSKFFKDPKIILDPELLRWDPSGSHQDETYDDWLNEKQH